MKPRVILEVWADGWTWRVPELGWTHTMARTATGFRGKGVESEEYEELAEAIDGGDPMDIANALEALGPQQGEPSDG